MECESSLDGCTHTCVETLAMCVRLSPGEESLGTRALGIIWAGRTCVADNDCIRNGML